jgi:modulator of FtsH protease
MMGGMSNAYHAGAWSSFAVAEVSAAAALAGLLVVAASVNIASIIRLPAVVARMAGALALFTGVLVVGTLLLVPGQPRGWLGVEIAVIGAGTAAIVAWQHGLKQVQIEFRKATFGTVSTGIAAGVIIAFAGVSTALGALGGLYWLVPGALLAFGVGLLNAWVALVEIQR